MIKEVSDLEEQDLPNITPDYLSVRDAANILGVSERSVYGYIEEKKLPGFKATNLIVVSRQDLLKFKRGTTGRPRKSVPEWRISDNENQQYLTQIFTQVVPDQKDALASRLEEFHKNDSHKFPGTIARYLSLSEDGLFVQILLIWRKTVMPDQAKRDEAINALGRELKDVIFWEHAVIESHEILMHT